MTDRLIPQPKNLVRNEGTTGFTLHNGCTLKDMTGTEGIFDDFCVFLGEKFGYVPLGGERDGICLTFSDEIKNAEGYRLVCRSGSITVTAAAPAGLFYALQTLKQLLSSTDGTLPELTVTDEPRYEQRGLMLDCARHFFSTDSLKKLLDAMALHKLNRLHLHLSDDQGWRMESQRYPLLTLIGSQRAYTALDRVRHTGYYTAQEIKELVRYAEARYIRIIPGIPLPGHCTAAIAAMPELSCTGETVDVSVTFGKKKNILCMGSDKALRFAEEIVTEAAALFHSNEVHIGCNDVPPPADYSCPRCKAKSRSIPGEKGCDGLLLHFADGIRKANGSLRLMVWNNAMPDSFSLQYAGKGEEKDGIFIDSGEPLNLSAPYAANDLHRCYAYAPAAGAKGIEALLYSEYIPTFEKACYYLFPRLAAVSETAWTPQKNRCYDAFCTALPAYFDLLELYALPHASIKQAMPSFFAAKEERLRYTVKKLLSEKND